MAVLLEENTANYLDSRKVRSQKQSKIIVSEAYAELQPVSILQGNNSTKVGWSCLTILI